MTTNAEEQKPFKEPPKKDKESLELVDPVWERQPWETIRQFQSFLSYRDFTPPYERTINKAWRQFRGVTDETRKMPGSFAQMAAENQWVNRAAAYESDLSRQRRERWEREVDETRDRVLQQARGLGSHVSQRLNELAENVKEGKEKMPLSLIASWAKLAFDTQLHVVGYVPPQKVEADVNVAGPGGVPLDFVIRPQLSDEDLFQQAKDALEAEQALAAQAEQADGQDDADGANDADVMIE